jgi:dTDP-4-amino-4,6-dideoxygalactose transaminase
MDDIQGKRLAIWNTYDKVLRGKLNNGIILPELPEYATNNAHMYYLLCPSLDYRTAFMGYLKENDVIPTFHYLPLHSSAYYKDKHDGRELPSCDRYGDCLVRLPLYYELSFEDAKRIARLILEYRFE